MLQRALIKSDFELNQRANNHEDSLFRVFKYQRFAQLCAREMNPKERCFAKYHHVILPRISCEFALCGLYETFKRQSRAMSWTSRFLDQKVVGKNRLQTRGRPCLNGCVVVTKQDSLRLCKHFMKPGNKFGRALLWHSMGFIFSTTRW